MDSINNLWQLLTCFILCWWTGCIFSKWDFITI